MKKPYTYLECKLTLFAAGNCGAPFGVNWSNLNSKNGLSPAFVNGDTNDVTNYK
jgi:hypothetical protein